MDQKLVLFKMNIGVDGADLVGELVSSIDSLPPGSASDDGFLLLKALRVIVYKANGPNSVTIAGFAPFLIPAGDGELALRDRDIITMIPCPEIVAKLYREAVSPIVLPTKPTLVRP